MKAKWIRMLAACLGMAMSLLCQTTVLAATTDIGAASGESLPSSSTQQIDRKEPPAACRYHIEAAVDPECSVIQARTRLTYRNDGPVSLDSLAFRLRGRLHPETAGGGSVAVWYLHETRTQDSPFEQVAVQMRAGENESDVGSFLVRLPRPLGPGQSLCIETRSQSNVQELFGCLHVEGPWHPRLSHRAGGQWRDDLDSFADYQVTLSGVAKPQIPVSGRIIRQDKDASGRWTIVSQASGIPDFAMVFSKADHCLSVNQNTVSIHCFYDREKNKPAAQRMATIAQDVIRFYRELYGYYPADVLNIICNQGNGFGGGPYGSNIVFVNNSFERSEDNTVWAVAHEIAHEYWGWNRVVDANPNLRWLCLGMGLWTDRQYMDSVKRIGRNNSIANDYRRAAARGRNTKLLDVTTADREDRMDERELSHGKGYQIVLLLEYLFGTDTIKAIARETLDRYARQPIDAKGFQEVCQEVTGQDLEWFFQEWLCTNDICGYAIKDVTVGPGEGGERITVSIEPRHGIVMPVDVMVEYEDGTQDTQRIAHNQRQCSFALKKPWRRVIADPQNSLPSTNRQDVVKANPAVSPAFEIIDVSLGDKAWGLNHLRVQVRNRTPRQRRLHVHVGDGNEWEWGFGHGQVHRLAGHETRWLEQWYWVPPVHGKGTFRVTFRDPISERTPAEDPPFQTNAYPVIFPIPNTRCNDLMCPDFPAAMQRIEPFQHRRTEHFVFYFSPKTPAADDVEVLVKEHETALAGACEFFGVPLPKDMVVFFYPDRLTKWKIANHDGDGMASDTTIALVYNEKTHVDPYHEITHVIAGRVGNPPAMFREGLATWMQKDHAQDGKTADAMAGQLRREEELVPLSALMARTEIGSDGSGRVGYPESASFVGFLIATYGKEKFLKAYATMENDDQVDAVKRNVTRMQEVFGEPLNEIEKRWLASLTLCE